MRDSIEEESIVLQGVHFAGAEPFCLETRAINVAAVPMATEMDFSVSAPGIWLLQSMPWSTARHVIRAVNATGRDASLLDLPLGSACLEMLRETRSGGNWVTYARLLYPGEAHQLVAEFEPQAGGEARSSLQ
jgi:GntR family histidine utilization transcriptional repressor